MGTGRGGTGENYDGNGGASVAPFPPGITIVSLQMFNDGHRDRLFVATSNGVYEFINEVLVPLKFQETPPEQAADDGEQP